ncbi:MAG: N-acetylmuramoyl-L-alanine amidase [Lachnospiraceae bacterium]|nr:N-acetylmuramoyl-L-alanine amidase [Lachnospiraceae bacterium]
MVKKFEIGADVSDKKWELTLALILLTIVSLLAERSELLAVVAPAEQKSVVVLDAGHGGMDSGKVAVNNILEKDINLKIVYFLKTALEEQGITVVLTREDEDGLYQEGDSNKKLADMRKRCEIIEKSGCILAVSIHQNSYHEAAASGPQVFYYVTSEKGKKIAETLQNSLVEGLNPAKIRTAKSNDNYYLLKNVSCPIVIVECGFLSNWEEAELLCTEEYQKKVAETLAEGILEYLKTVS